MYETIVFVTSVLGLFTFIAHIVFGVLILFFLAEIFIKKKVKWLESIFTYIAKEATFFIFLIAALAVAMSLFYSEFAGFEPCLLCWWQRIFMYPIAIIALVALIKKDKSVFHYFFPLALIGFFIGVYHYIIQMKEIFGTDIGLIVPCSVEPGSIPCESFYFLEFGYITMPMMSVTAFLSILVILFLRKRKARG